MSKRARRPTVKETSTSYKATDNSLLGKAKDDVIKSMESELAIDEPDWTPEEVAAVCKHYQVATLDPEAWTEGDGLDEVENHSANSKTRAAQRRITYTAQSTAKKAKEATEGNVEILDPLGISDAAFKVTEGKRYSNLDPRSHSTTIFAFLIQIEEGMRHLQASIEQRNDLLKSLVKTNFSKFVSAKSTIDSFYDEMLNENLISSDSHGVAPFNRKLTSANLSATAFYQPMLERRNQAGKIRTVLLILDSWRFLFSLPSFLSDAVKKKKLDIVVREYNKGKYMMQTSMQTDTTKAEQANEIDAPLLIPKSHKKVFEKIWAEVEIIIHSLRVYLYDKLQDTNAPIEKQDIMRNLDPETDPAWFYVSGLYKHMIDTIVSLYNAFNVKVHIYASRIKHNSQDTSSNKWSTSDIKRLFNSMNKDDIEGFDSRLDVFVWKSVQLLVKSACEVMALYLPKFWRISRVFYTISQDGSDGQGVKRDADKLATCSEMLDNIYETFGSIIINLFHVTEPTLDLEKSAMSSNSPRYSNRPELPSLPEDEDDPLTTHIEETPTNRHILYPIHEVPVLSVSPDSVKKCMNTHPVVRIWFMTRIMASMSRFLFEIREQKVGGYYSERFIKPTVEKLNLLKDQTIEDISDAVVSGMYLYETWGLTKTDEVNKISAVVELSFRLFKYALRGLHRISIIYFGDAKRNLSSKAEKKRSRQFIHNGQSTLSKPSQDCLRYNIFDALYFLLDGMEWLVVNWKEEESATGNPVGLSVREHDAFLKSKKQAGENNFNVIVSSADTAQSVIGWTAAARDRTKNIDESYLDTRALIILGNLAFLESTAIPKICDIFENTLKLPIGDEKEHLLIILNHLDSVAFKNFCRRKFVIIHRLLRNGILMSGIDWNAMTSVQDVRPYCHEILLLLVTIHAHISDICKPQVSRILSELLHRIAEDILLSFRRIDSFNAHGMTHALLEVQFLQDTLYAYSTDNIHELFLQTYEILEKGIDSNDKLYLEYKVNELETARRFPRRLMDSDAFKGLIEEKDGLLEGAKNATRVQLMCFTENGGGREADESDDDDE